MVPQAAVDPVEPPSAGPVRGADTHRRGRPRPCRARTRPGCRRARPRTSSGPRRPRRPGGHCSPEACRPGLCPTPRRCAGCARRCATSWTVTWRAAPRGPRRWTRASTPPRQRRDPRPVVTASGSRGEERRHTEHGGNAALVAIAAEAVELSPTTESAASDPRSGRPRGAADRGLLTTGHGPRASGATVAPAATPLHPGGHAPAGCRRVPTP